MFQTVRIQRWFRKIHIEHPLRFTKNFRDKDCITLRPIRSYTSYQVFFITMDNNDVYAADACAWLDYFCRHSTTHPLTRMAIPLISVWNAFLVARFLLPQHSPLLLQCKSVKVKPERRLEQVTKREVIKLVPESPLLRIGILEIIDLPKVGTQCKKRIQYELLDSVYKSVNNHTYILDVNSQYPIDVECGF